MRSTLKEFRRLCKEANCDWKDAREFFRLGDVGDKEINDYIAYAIDFDNGMVNDAIEENKR